MIQDTIKELDAKIKAVTKKINDRSAKGDALYAEWKAAEKAYQKHCSRTRKLGNQLKILLIQLRNAKDAQTKTDFIGKFFYVRPQENYTIYCKVTDLDIDWSTSWYHETNKIGLLCAAIIIDNNHNYYNFSDKYSGLELLNEGVVTSSMGNLPVTPCTEEDFNNAFDEYKKNIDRLWAESKTIGI